METVTNCKKSTKEIIFDTLQSYTAKEVINLYKDKRALIAYGYFVLVVCLASLLLMIFFYTDNLFAFVPPVLGIFSGLAFLGQHSHKIRPAMIANLVVIAVVGAMILFFGTIAGGFSIFLGLWYIGIALLIFWAISEKKLFSPHAPSYKQLKYAMNCKKNNIQMDISLFPDSRQSEKWTLTCCIILWVNFTLNVLLLLL